jgi:hypothetical protein
VTTFRTSDFLTCLVPLDAAGYLNLRVFSPFPHNTLIKMSDPDAMDRIAAWVRQHRKFQDLYMGVAERRTDENGTKENCAVIRVLFCEIDFKDQTEAEVRAALAAYRFPPSIIVHSGGGLHVYWILDAPANLADPDTLATVEGAVRELVRVLGGDPNAVDASRVLRIPGTFNHKYGELRPVVLEHYEPTRRYALADFDQLAPVSEPEREPRAPGSASAGVVDRDRAVALLASTFPAPKGGIHYYILKLAGWFAHSGIAIEDAYDMLGAADGIACNGSATDRDTRAAIRDTYRKHAKGDEVAGLPSALAQVPALEPVLGELKAALGIVPVMAGGSGAEGASETAEPPTLETLQEHVREILALDDPLVAVREAIAAQGYGGSLDPPLIVYVAMTTRLLKKRTGSSPCHLLIIATSGGGKTYTEQLVCLFLPPEAMHRISAGSARALIYDKGSLEHRTLIFGESDSLPSDEDNPAASAIRALLQDSELSYDVVVKEPKGAGYVTKHIRRAGPTQFVTTATRRFRDHQMATRVFELEIPTDAQKIRAALKVQAQLVNEPAAEPSRALIDFQAYLQARAPWDVAVPFADALSELIGQHQHAPRILRDWTKIIALIQAVSLIRHARRETDTHGRVVATLEDYATVRELIGSMYEATVTGASQGVRQVAEAVAGGATSSRQVRQAMPGAPAEASVHRWISTALAHEWVRNTEANTRKPKVLAPGDPIPARVLLPTVEEVHSHTPLVYRKYRRDKNGNPENTGTYGSQGYTCGIPVECESDPESANDSNEIDPLTVSLAGKTLLECESDSESDSRDASEGPQDPQAQVSYCPTCQRFRCQCKGAV